MKLRDLAEGLQILVLRVLGALRRHRDWVLEQGQDLATKLWAVLHPKSP